MKFLLVTATLLCSLCAQAAIQLQGSVNLHAKTVSTPVVANGQMYIGADDGNLYAIDVATRKLTWLHHSWGGVASSPAVADGMVYFLGRDGIVHAVDAQSGKAVWQFQTQGEARFGAHGLYGKDKHAQLDIDPWDFYLSSPLVHKGRVYIGSSDERMYALDAKTGAVQWVFKSGGMIHAKPAVAGDTLIFGSWDGAVYALNADTGVQLWRYQTRTEQKLSLMFGVQAPPLIDGDTVYIGSRDGFFYALSLDKGEQRWRYDVRGSWVVSGAVADAERVYFGTSDTNLLVALDKRTGKTAYEHDTKVWTYATPLLEGDKIYAATMRGEVFALHASTGKPQWSWRSEESLTDEFRMLDPVSGKFNTKRLYDVANSAHDSLEQVKRLGAFLSSPIWHQGQLIVASADGKIRFFR